MRRVLLGSVVLFIAACGGGVRSEAKPEPQARRAIPTDPLSAQLVESLTATYGSDAVETCLAAWQDLFDGDERGPVGKPGAGFRRFISQCVGAPVPADMRRDWAGDVSSMSAGDLRIQSTRDLRMDRASPELRSTSAQ